MLDMQLFNNRPEFLPTFVSILKDSFDVFGKLYNECKNTGFELPSHLSQLGIEERDYTIKHMILFMRINMLMFNTFHYYFEEFSDYFITSNYAKVFLHEILPIFLTVYNNLSKLYKKVLVSGLITMFVNITVLSFSEHDTEIL